MLTTRSGFAVKQGCKIELMSHEDAPDGRRSGADARRRFGANRTRRRGTDHDAAAGGRSWQSGSGNRVFDLPIRKERTSSAGFTAETPVFGSAIERSSPRRRVCPQERVEADSQQGFANGAPDLAVEIFSPSDCIRQITRKVKQYLAAGCHTVWVVYPKRQEVKVFEASGVERTLHAGTNCSKPRNCFPASP